MKAKQVEPVKSLLQKYLATRQFGGETVRSGRLGKIGGSGCFEVTQ